MFTKKTTAPHPKKASDHEAPTKMDAKAEALANHRASAPADVKAAYALVEEYERRLPKQDGWE